MQRVTISLSDTLGDALEELVADRGYQSRYEAVRDLIRDGVEQWRHERQQGHHCVANLSYIVDRRVRSLPQRLTEMQHAHHDLVATSTVVRLDHFNSLESVILKGPTAKVRAFADQVRAERGVRFGAVNMLLVTPADDHDGPGDHHHCNHAHLSPRD